MIKAVIFDIGGTLLGAPDFIRELSKLFEKEGAYARIKAALFREISAIRAGEQPFLPMERVVQSTLLALSQDGEYSDMSQHARRVYYETFVKQSYLLPHAEAALVYLQGQGIKIYVASDADAEFLREEFVMHGIGGFFARQFISSELAAYKPHDDFVEALRRDIPESPEEMLLVGDSEGDILTGKKLGVKTVLISAKIPPSISPDYCIADLSPLIEIIEELNTASRPGFRGRV